LSSHDIDLNIIGEGVQLVEIILDPNETVIAEAGAMIYIEDGISYEIKMGDGSKTSPGFLDKLFSVGKRMLSGESLFLTHFTNNSNKQRKMAFAGNIPGSIVAVDLLKVRGSLICQRDAFLCAAYGTEITISFTKKLETGLLGGEGFILQKAKGEGKLVLNAGGKVIKKQLNNETIRVDAGCLVAFTDGIDYDIVPAGNIGSMLFGGEGLFFATLSGTGTVLLQSTTASKMAQTLMKNLPSASGTGNKGIVNVGDFLDKLT
jgi:uncharacterized protein (TIGR00266 family)